MRDDSQLVRCLTAGSVDDGKSTLIGRLLYDSTLIAEDQLAEVAQASRRGGAGALDLALLTDGLRAERERGITIDVAYRYFSSSRRRFILADTPGHEQYTRNMVTGASTADVAIILIDATRGVRTQSKRHGFICSLLGIRHLLVAVNKMDLVGYAETVFDRIGRDYLEFAGKLNVHDITFVPVSALYGANVVHRGESMPWYQGGTVLHYLEHVPVASDRNLVDFRFPVQYVVRAPGVRGYAGRVVSGAIRPGEEVVVLPSRRRSRIAAIAEHGCELSEAIAGQPVVVTLSDNVDVGRGDMIVRRNNVPVVGRRFESIVCWMDDRDSLRTGGRLLLRHTTTGTTARVERIDYRIDVDTLHRAATDALQVNEIGRVRLSTSQPICYDPYAVNRETGAFILVDGDTKRTAGAGIILREARDTDAAAEAAFSFTGESAHVSTESSGVTRNEREARNGHKAAVVWLTGLSGAGKSTIARRQEQALFGQGVLVAVLDGDNMRHGLCGDLGYTAEDRRENVRRVAHAAKLFFDAGHVVICALISPFAADRASARRLVPAGRFFEVHVRCSLAECKRRDPKGLYAKALRGEIAEFTGVSSPYEEPTSPEIFMDTTRTSPAAAVSTILAALVAGDIVADSARNAGGYGSSST